MGLAMPGAKAGRAVGWSANAAVAPTMQATIKTVIQLIACSLASDGENIPGNGRPTHDAQHHFRDENCAGTPHLGGVLQDERHYMSAGVDLKDEGGIENEKPPRP